MPTLDENAFMNRSDTPNSVGWLRATVEMRERQYTELLSQIGSILGEK